MKMMLFLAFPLLFLGIHVYFFFADKHNIIDKPNNRSSHVQPTIRGGGIVFIMGLLFWFFTGGYGYPYLTAGAVLIAAISFMDDLRERPPGLRLAVHFLGFLLMAFELFPFYDGPSWVVAIVFVVAIGTLNAFNFMDGINGITGVYALVTLVTLLVIDYRVVDFTDEDLIFVLIASVLVFLVYNFRKKARCFAGDVGSITIAFLLIFLQLQLMLATGTYAWILLFTVYGVDAAITIVYRLVNKENILKAHRSHLYQFLANELRYSHLTVASFYGLVQLAINVLVITCFPAPSFMHVVLAILIVGVLYIVARERILAKLGKKRMLPFLFNKH